MTGHNLQDRITRPIPVVIVKSKARFLVWAAVLVLPVLFMYLAYVVVVAPAVDREEPLTSLSGDFSTARNAETVLEPVTLQEVDEEVTDDQPVPESPRPRRVSVLVEITSYLEKNEKFGAVLYAEEPTTEGNEISQLVTTERGVYSFSIRDGKVTGYKDRTPPPVVPTPKYFKNAAVTEYVEAVMRQAGGGYQSYTVDNGRGRRVTKKVYVPPDIRPLVFGSRWPLAVGRIGYLPDAEIFQIVDDNMALLSVGSDIVMVRKIDFSAAVDGKGGNVVPMMKVTRTTTYTTTLGGTNTVFVLEPFDIEKYNLDPAMLR